MEWWVWLIVGWLGASVCTTIGMCRWFKYVRGDFDKSPR
jgi:hypothetical protein